MRASRVHGSMAATWDAKDWFVLLRGKQYGPYTYAGLVRAAASGIVDPEAGVWCVGWDEWRIAHDVPGLFEQVPELVPDDLEEGFELSRGGRSRQVCHQGSGTLVRLINSDRNRLVELGFLPEVPTGFSRSLRENLEAVRRSTETRARLAEAEATASRDHAKIVVDQALLARAGDVLRLFGETGAYSSNQMDLPRIRAENDEYQGLLGEFAAQLGVDETAIERALPTDPAQALIRGLISEGRTITGTLGRHAAALATERADLREIEQQLAQRGGVINPRPLREQFSALAPVLSNLAKRTDTEGAIRTETRGLREAAARLHPPVTELEVFASAAIPSIETITRFRADLDALAAEMRREQDRYEAATDAMAAAESKLHELMIGRPVPSAEIIRAKRQQRNADWSTLRAILLGDSDALSGRQLVEVVTSFERHSLAADQLADSACSDAERVAAHAVETRRLGEERRKQTDAGNRIAALASAQQNMLGSWSAIWEPACLTPLNPSEMMSWRSALAGLLDRRERLKGLLDLRIAIDAAIGSIEPSLLALAAEIGLSVSERVEAGLVAAQVEKRLELIGETWEAARDLETRQSEVQRRIEGLVAGEAEAKRSLEEWLARWSIALPAIGIPAVAALEEAEGALGVWNKVPSTIRERNNRARRVAGMQRNVETFQRQTSDLLKDIAPELVALPADTAVKILNDRLIAARAAETRRAKASVTSRK